MKSAKEFVRLRDEGKALLEFDQYASMLRSADFVAYTRTALLWSAVSFFYIYGGLTVKSTTVATLLGVSIEGITHGKFLAFLFIMTLCYTTRLLVVIIKYSIVHQPIAIFRGIFNYKEHGHIEHLASVLSHICSANSQKRKKYFIENESEVHHFMLQHPYYGVLENFCVRMHLPWVLCVLVLGRLAKENFF